MKSYIAYTCAVILTVLLAAEIFLRVTHRYATYSESTGGKYTSNYNAVIPSWYKLNTPGRNYIPPNSDFQYPYAINDLGLREKNFTKQKRDSSIRIFVTGDSFSEGQGAPYDSTWPHLLASLLGKDEISAEVLNTGVWGSDPVYNYVLHRDILKGYKADYIIVPINSSDFTDYMLRGGFERFYANGTTHYKPGPAYEPLYKYSHFARGVIERVGKFPFRGIFANEQDFSVSANKAITCYESVIDSFVNLTKADSTQIIVLLFSTPAEIRYKSNEINTFKQAFTSLQQHLASKNVACINIWDDLIYGLSDKNYLQYTYPNDAHYRPYGYNLMAHLVEQQLLQKKLLSKQSVQ